jgi:2-haloalkanoic acid dehalogenase type II
MSDEPGMPAQMRARFDAIVFDLLTALIDSWSLWNSVAGSDPKGLAWRQRYLDITYGCGAYRPYETLVREAAVQAGLPAEFGAELERRWKELSPWPEARTVLSDLAQHLPLAIATNCSDRLAGIAADRTGARFAAIVTAENVGFYKPRAEVYRAVLARLGTEPPRTLFVAGSASDVPGAKGVGMPVYWHNRIGLLPRNDARPDVMKASLQPLVAYAGVSSGGGA